MIVFSKMPFGLRNAAQTFLGFIDEVLRRLPFVFTYVDYLLIARQDKEEDSQYLQQVLNVV